MNTDSGRALICNTSLYNRELVIDAANIIIMTSKIK
jgi:hypothetical protein